MARAEHPFLVLSPEMNLTTKERYFIIEFCSNGFRKDWAARDAGYKCAIVSGRERWDAVTTRLFKKPDVNKAISDFLSNAVESAKGKLEYQLSKYYYKRAFYNPFDIIDENGALKPDFDLSGPNAVCVDGIITKYYNDGEGLMPVKTVKLADREKAMAQLAKYIGMIKDTNIHNHLHLPENPDDKVDSIDEIEDQIKKIDLQLGNK